jgi:hypothetical protein
MYPACRKENQRVIVRQVAGTGHALSRPLTSNFASSREVRGKPLQLDRYRNVAAPRPDTDELYEFRTTAVLFADAFDSPLYEYSPRDCSHGKA